MRSHRGRCPGSAARNSGRARVLVWLKILRVEKKFLQVFGEGRKGARKRAGILKDGLAGGGQVGSPVRTWELGLRS